MPKVMHSRKRAEAKRSKLIVSKSLATGPAIRGTKQEAGDALERIARPRGSAYDFFANVSAADLARAQRVQPIRKLGQIRTFSDPDPKEADWLVRKVRRWRSEGQPRAAVR